MKEETLNSIETKNAMNTSRGVGAIIQKKKY